MFLDRVVRSFGVIDPYVYISPKGLSSSFICIGPGDRDRNQLVALHASDQGMYVRKDFVSLVFLIVCYPVRSIPTFSALIVRLTNIVRSLSIEITYKNKVLQ
jgi:hypothetical protein